MKNILGYSIVDNDRIIEYLRGLKKKGLSKEWYKQFDDIIALGENTDYYLLYAAIYIVTSDKYDTSKFFLKEETYDETFIFENDNGESFSIHLIPEGSMVQYKIGYEKDYDFIEVENIEECVKANNKKKFNE